MNLDKRKDSLFFSLCCDKLGSYISLVDGFGNQISNLNNYHICDENDLKLINYIDEIRRDSFFHGWENKTTELYIDENIEILEYIKNSSRVVSSSMKPLNWILKNNKIVLKISKLEENSDIYEGKLLLNGEKNFEIISDNYVLSDTTVYYIELQKNTLFILYELVSQFHKDDLEKYLSLAYSFGNGIEIDFNNFKIVENNNLTPTKNIAIEKISQDNSLYLNIGMTISTIDYEFLKEYNIKKALILNYDLRQIEIITVNLSDFDKTFEDIIKFITKRQKNMQIRSNFYFDNNFLILQEPLAKEFVIKDLLHLSGKYKIIGTGNLKKYNIRPVKPKITGTLNHGINFLEGNIQLDLEGESFSIAEVLNRYKKDSYIVLNDGTNALLNRKYMEKLERIFKQNDNDNVTISFFDLPIVDDIIDNKILLEEIKKTKSFYNGINQIESYATNTPIINATLRNYQEYGYKWLKYLIDNNLGGCLADDMGLGKTLQAITLITSLHTSDKRKTLIIMPKSLIYNWENEIHKFSPNLNCGIFYGNSRNRTIFNKYEVIITTYGTVRNDIEFFKELEFDLIILDESQNIKNVNAQTTKAVMLLNSKYRLALSGTPIENNLTELYSLFRFLNPSMFGTLDEFNYHYANPIQRDNDKDAIDELKKKIYPFILRRVKKDVLKDLPDKIEKTLFIEMNSEQRKIYEEKRTYYYDLIHNQIKNQGINKSQFYILQAINELRQITSCPEMKNSKVISSKRAVLIEQIKDSVENGHKVLVFTNYIKSISSIVNDLKKIGIKYLEMSGITKDRQNLVDKFQNESQYKVFVMTLKTGGIGLNLTAADTIFIYDPWWNKTVENQAIDRAYRLGQDRTVFSYKLILKNTIEEKILKLQEHKSRLLDNLISDEGTTLKSLSEQDIEFILGK